LLSKKRETRKRINEGGRSSRILTGIGGIYRKRKMEFPGRAIWFRRRRARGFKRGGAVSPFSHKEGKGGTILGREEYEEERPNRERNEEFPRGRKKNAGTLAQNEEEILPKGQRGLRRKAYASPLNKAIVS